MTLDLLQFTPDDPVVPGARMRSRMHPSLCRALLRQDPDNPRMVVAGGACVRALLDIDADYADFDVFLLHGHTWDMRLRPKPIQVWHDRRDSSVTGGYRIDFIWHEGRPYLRAIDVIPTGLDVPGLLDRFDVNIARVAWAPGPHPAEDRWWADPSTREDLAARRVVMRDVPWRRPHREAKYRRMLGLGPKPGEVLPMIGAPYPVSREHAIPEGFRPISADERKYLMIPAPDLTVAVPKTPEGR